MKHDYHIETFTIGKWLRIITGSRDYCRGYLNARKDLSPRNAYRIVRSDDKVVEEFAAYDEVSVGQIAGFPTAEQYERAGTKAFDMAKVIREQKQREEESRNKRLNP